MVDRVGRWVWVACAVLGVACGSSGSGAGRADGSSQAASSPDPNAQPSSATPSTPPSTSPPAAPPPAVAPVTRDGWTFYGAAQGLSKEIVDVSADEGGNVYVAGTDALYVKQRGDQGFLRFDATNGGITKTVIRSYPNPIPGFAAALDGHLHPDPPGPAQRSRSSRWPVPPPGVPSSDSRGSGPTATATRTGRWTPAGPTSSLSTARPSRESAPCWSPRPRTQSVPTAVTSGTLYCDPNKTLLEHRAPGSCGRSSASP